MTNKERVIAAINFKKTDFVPHSVSFTEEMYDKIKDKLGTQYFEKMNNHIEFMPLRNRRKKLKKDFFRMSMVSSGTKQELIKTLVCLKNIS